MKATVALRARRVAMLPGDGTVKRRRRYTMICGACEQEWDADGPQPREVCPSFTCGFVDKDLEEHVIRDERVVPAVRAAMVMRSRP